MKRLKGQPRHHASSCLVLIILLGAGQACLAQSSSPNDKPPAPDILDASSKHSSSGSSSNGQMQCTSNIKTLGMLPLAKVWTEDAPVTVSKQPLAQGACIGYRITPAELANTACGAQAPDSFILIEFWQLNRTLNSSNATAAAAAADAVVPDADSADVRVLAARGTQPWVTVSPDGHMKVTPPIRDADTGLTPVGTFQDDAAVVYSRATARVFFPTSSPMTDVGEPLDPDTWYITIAAKPRERSSAPLAGYAVRAACLSASPPPQPKGQAGKAAAAALGDTTDGVPCPVAAPGGPQCSGRGVCRVDSTPQPIDRSRFCDCDEGFGSYACQQVLPMLPVNAPAPTVVTVGPGQWGFWEVTLPGLRSGLAARGAGGPSRDAVAAAAAGLGQGLVGNEVLLVNAQRLDTKEGYGGNPLVFLKPFMTKDHNQPALDALDNDVINYADLRSFQLQLNRHYLIQRLPLRDSTGPAGAAGYAMPRRWYIAVYNSNATRLSEPVKVALDVQYRDINRQLIVCPFNCSNRGRCVDPKPPMPSSALVPLNLGTSDASIVTALGPMQDQSPVDAGFMCMCSPGYGGLTCEGRVQNVTVGSGDQKLGPEDLQPGEWFFYVVTVDQGFNPQSHNLGIQWTIGQPSSPPSNYTTAYISFDQGPLPSGVLGDRRLVIPVCKSMTPYSKLVVRDNPPLPLQVPGGQLSPGGTYVVSIFNNDYVLREAFEFTLTFFVMSDRGSFLHPYMSILLGVTAAVILCLAMTLCKRVVMRYGFVPWRWRQRRRQLQAAAAAGNGQPGQGNSLALVLMAQSQQSNRGVPPEIYQAFPCRPYALKDYQQRQHDLQQQQQPESDVASMVDQNHQQQPRRHLLQPQHSQVFRVQLPGAPSSPLSSVSMVSSGVTGATGPRSDIEQQQQQQQQQHPGSGRVVEVAAGAGRQPLHARLSHLSQQLSMQLSGVLPGAAAAGAAGASAAGSVAGGGPLPHSGSNHPNAGKSSTAGASAEEDDLALVRDDDAPSCTVCLGEYVPEEMVRQLPCGHEFHQVCIDQWMANHGTCPICRAPLWPGAYEPEEDASEDASGTEHHPPDSTPANIYVHHAMANGGSAAGTTAGGATGASGAGAGQVAPAAGATAAARDSRSGAAATGDAGAGGGGVAAAGGGGSQYVPVGVNEHQPQRLLWLQQHHQQLLQQQQQQWHPLQPMSPPSPTGGAVYTGEQAQRQQQQQQRQPRHSAASDTTATTTSDWNIPAVPDTWRPPVQQQQQQQQPQFRTRPRYSTN